MSNVVSPAETDFDFASKYTKQSLAMRVLIANFFRHVGKTVRDLEPKNVLEVGCGEGFSTEKLRKVLPRESSLRACDVEQRLVRAAQARNPDVEIREASIYGLPHEDDSFDLVLSLEVLEHLEEPEKALKELCRVTSKWLILSVPREPIFRSGNMLRGKYVRDFGNTPGHIQHWSRRSFVRFVSQHADVREVRTPLPWTVVLAAKR